MLVKLIQRVNEEVSRLCVDSAVPAFVSEWLRRRPDTKAEIAKTVPGNDDAERQMTLDGAIVSMAKGALGRIKKIPEMTNVMLERLQARGTEPAVRCALASILAYVVQPRDLIPDNAPGGYGFLDDAVMVHAGYLNKPLEGSSLKNQKASNELRRLHPAREPQGRVSKIKFGSHSRALGADFVAAGNKAEQCRMPFSPFLSI